MALIEIEHAGKEYRSNDGGAFTALQDVNLEIERGEFICLLGPSGCGKSTLLNALAGFDLATSGSIRIEGQEVTGPKPEYVTIFQQYGLLPWRTVLDNVKLGLEGRSDITPEQADRTALEFLDMVGLADFRDAHPRELSGGMQQRVQISKALANNPSLLLLDEVTTGLDLSVQAKVLDLIRQIKARYGISILLVSHDLAVIRMLADRTVVMLDGKIIESGLTDQILEDPQHAYTQQLVHSLL